MPGLFDVLDIRGVRIRNRIGVSPMVQASSHDGFATDWHLVHLGARALGGAGLVLTEAAAVEARGRITDRDLGLWDDEHMPRLRRVAEFVARAGATPGIQLAHAGRKASYCSSFSAQGMQAVRPLRREEGAWEPIGPSPVAFESGGPAPREMDRADVDDVVRAFVDAAKRADACGFEWIEVHAAHGYLLHSFCSPLSNQRRDEFGGSFDNRIRLMRLVAQALRRAWPDRKVLSFRLSFTDWIQGGWTIEDTVALARRLKDDGVDLIDVSSGGTSPKTVALMGHLSERALTLKTAIERAAPVAEIPIAPGYQVPGAEAVRLEAGLATAAVGLITEPEHADAIIRSGKADMVMLARALLRDPNWPLQAAAVLGQSARAEIPAQYYLGWKDVGDFVYRPIEID